MLTLNDFTAFSVSLAQAQTVSGGATIYVGSFNTPTGRFDEYVTVHDDGSFSSDYDNDDTGIQGYSGADLIASGDKQIIP